MRNANVAFDHRVRSISRIYIIYIFAQAHMPTPATSTIALAKSISFAYKKSYEKNIVFINTMGINGKYLRGKINENRSNRDHNNNENK